MRLVDCPVEPGNNKKDVDARHKAGHDGMALS
jgi:hypothetical protein